MFGLATTFGVLHWPIKQAEHAENYYLEIHGVFMERRMLLMALGVARTAEEIRS